jgi:hypothetical protein
LKTERAAIAMIEALLTSPFLTKFKKLAVKLLPGLNISKTSEALIGWTYKTIFKTINI